MTKSHKEVSQRIWHQLKRQVFSQLSTLLPPQLQQPPPQPLLLLQWRTKHRPLKLRLNIDNYHKMYLCIQCKQDLMDSGYYSGSPVPVALTEICASLSPCTSGSGPALSVTLWTRHKKHTFWLFLIKYFWINIAITTATTARLSWEWVMTALTLGVKKALRLGTHNFDKTHSLNYKYCGSDGQ